MGLTRLVNRPFTVTEFHFVPPNAYRAESGLLYGAFAALQDWSGLYRFAYSGDPRETFTPAPVSFFDIVNDPATQAAEYAGVALFLRGDLAPAPHAVVVAGPEDAFWKRADERVGSAAERLAWVTRIGSLIGPAAADQLAVAPGDALSATVLLESLRARGWVGPGNATDLAHGVSESETGEVGLATADGTLRIATPRTAGVVQPAGLTRTAGPLTVATRGAFAAVWASSLDGRPLASSRRILLAHVTDVKNTGDRFRGRDMKVLEGWGKLPYLARAGQADIALAVPAGSRWTVWRLNGSGKRLARVTSRVQDAALHFTATTATRPDATFFYEILGN
jgi:hypothetical protein